MLHARPTRRGLLASALIAGAISFAASPALAQWPADPSSGLPICNLLSNQDQRLVAPNGNAGAFIAWRDERLGSGLYDAYIQRVDAVGNRLWTANGLVVATPFAKRYAESLLSDGTGGVFVGLTDLRSSSLGDIYAQRLDASGSQLWGAGGVAVCAALGSQSGVQCVSDGAGGVILVWLDGRAGSGTSSYSFYAQRLNAAGVPQWAANGVPVTGAIGPFYNGVRVATDGAGGVVMTWSNIVDIFAQRLDANGNRLWGANGVTVCNFANQQDHAVITTDGAAGAIIAWWDSRPGNSGLADVYGQRINAAGTPVWTLNGRAIASAANAQREVELVSDGAGGAIAVWHDGRFSPSPPTDLFAQRVDPNGDPLWTAAGVRITSPSTALSNSRLLPAITADGAGGVMMCWRDSRTEALGDLYAARLNALGQSMWNPGGVPVCIATGLVLDPAVALLSDGALIMAWDDWRTGSQGDIYAHRLEASGLLGPPLPTPAMASLVSVAAAAGSVRVTGYAVDLGSSGIKLERSTDDDSWLELAQISPDGSGQFEYDDRSVRAGERYAYRLTFTDQGIVRRTPATWVQVPMAVGFSLALAGPQPSQGDIEVRFGLGNAGDAQLELFDLSGRRVELQVVGREAVGVSRAILGRGRALAPGVYLVRLARGAEQRIARAVVAR